jgi:NAD(P)-dependent dehydrogenase (short-subunit alcohol dehydrogenase family)
MLFDLSGKVAIVTGSSRGIGRAIAEALAQAGARVVISSRKPGPCEAVARHINEAAAGAADEPRAIAVPASISSKDDLKRLVETTMARWNRIDILVCNAASNPHYGPLGGITDEQFRKILDNNILSSHWLVQLVAPQMIARRDGAIIIVSSIGALKGSPVIGAYNISKAADLQLARNLAVEYGRHNVRVNCILPGLVQTDFARALWEDPAARARAEALTPLGRIGQPADIAGAAVFLASAAGAFMTGQQIVIDGGATIAWSYGG